jgi:ribosome-binding factor A
MATRRMERVSEAIREVVASAILFELKDPRVLGVTVTRAEVTGDLRHAKVYVSLMGSEKQQQLTLRGLQSARGFLQGKVAERLQTRWTPVLQFVADQSVKKSIEISRLIDKALAGSRPTRSPDPGAMGEKSQETEEPAPEAAQGTEAPFDPELPGTANELRDGEA